MSTAFDLDQDGWKKRIADARLSSFDANEELDASAGEGIAKGAAEGTMGGFARVAEAGGVTLGGTLGRGMDIAGAAGDTLDALTFDEQGHQTSALVPQGTKYQDAFFQTTDDIAGNAVDFWTPSSREVGAIGRTLGGFAEMIGPLMAGGGNPALLIGTSGIEGGKEIVDQGVDATTAVASGTLDAAATAVGFKLPFLGKSLTGKVLTGGAGNVLVGAGTTELQRELLAGRGYDELAQDYNPLDVQSRAIDLLTGMAFGGIDWASVRRADRDVSLAANNAKHYQQDTAPGIPQDFAAISAHGKAMDRAFDQMIRGEPVSVDPAVMDGNFKERPAKDYSADEQAIREIIGELPQARVEEPHEVVRPEVATPPEVPHADIESLAAEEPLKKSLREVYEKAVEVKPRFDAGVRDIAREIGSTHEPLIAPLKGVSRAAEKIVADYGGDARQIKDVVRATVLVDDVSQANAAVKAAIAKFGEPTKQRNTLDPKIETADGYRDVNLNFKLDGHTVELQVNVPEMVKAKLANEGLYHERRTIQAKSKRTAADDARIDQLDEQMKGAYAAAWKEALSRSKASEEISSPSLRSKLSETGRPPGTSNARHSEPPASVRTSDAGTPSTSKNLGSLSKNAMGESSTGIIRDGSFESPVITELKEQLKQRDVMMATGEIDAEGNAVVRSGREVLAQAEADVAAAIHDSQAFEAAVTCFLTHGEQ